MSMSQNDLIEIAEKHKENPGVRVILQSLREAKAMAMIALESLKLHTQIAERQL